MGTRNTSSRHKPFSSPGRTNVGSLFLLVFILAGLTGCRSKTTLDGSALPGTSSHDGTNMNRAVAGDTGSTLRVGDFITIAFTDIPVGPATTTMTREQKVRIPDDGMITLPYNVHVQAAGKSIPEMEADIRAKYVPDLFQSLTAIVTPEARFYYVGGEVKLPGKQAYVGNVTVLRAIETAGGFTDFARRSNIEVRRSNGKVEHVNWKKARKNSKLDLEIFPNDHVIVTRGI